MATKTEAIRWLNEGYDITPIQVSYDDEGHASKKPILAYATDKLDKLWVLSNWKRHYAIALVMSGSDYVCFDFDDMHEYTSFQVRFPTIEDGVIEESVSGRGVHVFFKNNHSLTQVIGIEKGLDIKASKNNYAVVDSETDLSECVDLPDELLEFYHENKAKGQKITNSFEGQSSLTIPELAMITEGFGAEGTRNRNMSVLVWTLMTMGFPKQAIYSVIELANQHSGLTQSEIEKTIEGSWRKWTNGN